MRRTLIAAVVFTIVFIAGCGHYGALTDDYGKSYNMAKQGQILNPDASKNLEPVTGLNGTAAEAVMKKYNDSFKKGKDCDQSAQQGFTLMPAGAVGADTYGKQD